jgi:glycosyltransferase involved in cell wall biosynthesis
LHLVQTAEWLDKIGISIKLICGWVPRNPTGLVVRICSSIIGRDLSSGMKKRVIMLSNGGVVISCCLIDFIGQGALWIGRKVFGGIYRSKIMAIVWRAFGWQSKRYIDKFCANGRTIFHVRSGAGQGGAIKLARKLGIPVLVDHSIAHPEYMEKNLRQEYEKNKAFFDFSLKSEFWKNIVADCDDADVLLVNSHFVKDTFIQSGYPSNKIRVAYLGVRSDFFNIRKVQAVKMCERKFKLLFTGGFGFRKGAEYIFNAIRILKEKTSILFEMDIVGDYTGAIGIIEKYKEEKLPIVFHGPIPQDDLKNFLSLSDIYLFPSLAEGCASSGMEALAAGLCVVATIESGLPIEDGVNGCVIPAKDSMAIVEKLLYLMESPAEIDRLGDAASKLIRENYTWENYADNVKSVYEEMLRI